MTKKRNVLEKSKTVSMVSDMNISSMVVTGAGSGLGRSISLVFARAGCVVGAADINLATAEETVRLIKEAGGNALAFHVDVSDPVSVEKMATYFYQEWGRVDLMVNNAGIANVGLVGEVTPDDWKQIIDINQLGMIYGCHTFIPRMKKQGGGHIVNVASAGGLICLPQMSPYNVSKAAVIALSETLKQELASFNIHITVLCPSFFKTNLTDEMKYTDKFQLEFTGAAFNNARITSDMVAESLLKAVRKRKLYCIPQFPAKSLWFLKRMMPSVYHGGMALVYRSGGERLALWLAKKGLV